MKTSMSWPLLSTAVAAVVAFAMAADAWAQPPAGAQERRGPPSPERFIEHAMTFDADGDGKLDRAELTKFAAEMHARRMRGGPDGPGGAGGPGGPQGGKGQRRGPGAGRGPRGQGPGGPGGGPDDGDRPAPPERPE